MYHTQLNAKGKCSKEITTDNKNEPHTRILRRYCHVLATRIAGEPPDFRGNPLVCRNEFVKVKKQKRQIAMKLQIAKSTATVMPIQLNENRGNGEPGRLCKNQLVLRIVTDGLLVLGMRKWSMLMYLSFISYPKLASWYHPQIS